METKKESIIRKLKENKKLILVFSIIFISGLIVGVSISMVKLPKSKPKYYIAIDDIGTSGNKDPFADSVKITYDGNYVYFGWYCINGDPRNSKGFIMRFDLRNKPKSWSKCEISLYVYKNVRGSGSGLIYLFAGNWTEEEWNIGYNYMSDYEIYWKIEESVGYISNSDIGFHRTDITEYIANITTETFSIAVMPKYEFNGYGFIYSSEWNGTDPIFPYTLPEKDSYKAYLPQLIWS